jgi:hypothetical protein
MEQMSRSAWNLCPEAGDRIVAASWPTGPRRSGLRHRSGSASPENAFKQRHGAHAVLTGLLDRSALCGVLAEIEALGLNLLEVRQLTADCESPGIR